LDTKRDEKERKAKGRKEKLLRQDEHREKVIVDLERPGEKEVLMEEMDEQELDEEMMEWLREYESRNDGRNWL
jgi:hypothetical protein